MNERENENREEEVVMSGFLAVPEGCISAIISFTSPRDACRLACVSTTFSSAADSDYVWDSFLSPLYVSAISDSGNASSSSLSKKELYFQACNNPVLINDGKLVISHELDSSVLVVNGCERNFRIFVFGCYENTSGYLGLESMDDPSFWLDKPSGKKCYMISPRELKIVWGDTPEYYNWISLAEARFPEVAELRDVCWFDIRGEINTSLLSPSTTYVVYLVFKPFHRCYGFRYNPVEVTVGLAGNDDQKRTVYLDTGKRRNTPQWHPLSFHRRQASLPADDHRSFPKKREDGWLESELGEHFYGGDEDGELSMTILEVKRGNWKGGLVFQGIEIRPKKE